MKRDQSGLKHALAEAQAKIERMERMMGELDVCPHCNRLIIKTNVTPSLFREACERIADMLRQDDGEAFFEAEKFLKRHAPDLYDKIGISGGTCDLQMREDERK